MRASRLFETDSKILAISPYPSKVRPQIVGYHRMVSCSAMRFLYLHGFASSPASRKARLFAESLRLENIHLDALDLAPDFTRLTITGQLEVIEKAAQGDSVVLIGSSLGGYLAAIYAEKHPEVSRLLLLAPAFDFLALWTGELGPEKLREWRKNGAIPVFHYGVGREVPLGYQMMEDAEQYRPFPNFHQPCLILHGLRDTVVPYESLFGSFRSTPTQRSFRSIPGMSWQMCSMRYGKRRELFCWTETPNRLAQRIT